MSVNFTINEIRQIFEEMDRIVKEVLPQKARRYSSFLSYVAPSTKERSKEIWYPVRPQDLSEDCNIKLEVIFLEYRNRIEGLSSGKHRRMSDPFNVFLYGDCFYDLKMSDSIRYPMPDAMAERMNYGSFTGLERRAADLIGPIMDESLFNGLLPFFNSFSLADAYSPKPTKIYGIQAPDAVITGDLILDKEGRAVRFDRYHSGFLSKKCTSTKTSVRIDFAGDRPLLWRPENGDIMPVFAFVPDKTNEKDLVLGMDDFFTLADVSHLRSRLGLDGWPNKEDLYYDKNLLKPLSEEQKKAGMKPELRDEVTEFFADDTFPFLSSDGEDAYISFGYQIKGSLKHWSGYHIPECMKGYVYAPQVLSDILESLSHEID